MQTQQGDSRRPSVDVLMITYNRAEYTRLSLESLLGSGDESMRVWVWHNGGSNDTLEVVRSFAHHPRLYRLEVSPENVKLREPTNWFWSESDGEFVCKVDDDCLVPKGWAATLSEAHRLNPDFGILACWHFQPEDFDPKLSAFKIRSANGDYQLLENCWVQGSGYMMKRECVKANGPLRPEETFTEYCIRFALSGWRNGWLMPLIYEDHMDDPRSPNNRYQTDGEFASERPLSAVFRDVDSLAEWEENIRRSARVVQEAHPDPRHHAGWRVRLQETGGKLRRLVGRTPAKIR